MIDEIKKELTNYIGEEVVIKHNLGRNKSEQYNVTIKELYDFIFLVELESNEKKSFSYSDVLTKVIRIDFWKYLLFAKKWYIIKL